MKVWVLWYTHGFTVGVLDCAADADLAAGLKRAGDELRRAYGLGEGRFQRVRQHEPSFRDDERLYRLGGATIIARPFMVGEA